MEQGYHLAFGPFHLDGPQGRLWQGDQALPLRPQSLALLRYSAPHVFVFEDSVADPNWRGEEGHA